jgi:hypothetical protein
MKLPSYLKATNKKQSPLHLQKIVKIDFFSKNSISMSNYIIKNIPYYYHYFSLIESYKNIISAPFNVQCFKNDSATQYVIILYPNKQSFRQFFNSQSNNTFFYIEGFRRLTEILNTLKKHKIVHFNISEDSIVFSNERPFLSDFSHSFLTIIPCEIYQPTFTNRPPSWHLLCYLTQNKLQSASMSNIDTILHDYIDNATKNFDLAEDFWMEFRMTWTEILQRYIHKSREEISKLEKPLNYDIYGLSFLYLKLSSHIKDNIFIQKFIKLLKKNVVSNE